MIMDLHGMRMIGSDMVDMVQPLRGWCGGDSRYHGRRASAVNNIESRRLSVRAAVCSLTLCVSVTIPTGEERSSFNLVNPGCLSPGERGMIYTSNPGGVALTYASAYA